MLWDKKGHKEKLEGVRGQLTGRTNDRTEKFLCACLHIFVETKNWKFTIHVRTNSPYGNKIHVPTSLKVFL